MPEFVFRRDLDIEEARRVQEDLDTFINLDTFIKTEEFRRRGHLSVTRGFAERQAIDSMVRAVESIEINGKKELRGQVDALQREVETLREKAKAADEVQALRREVKALREKVADKDKAEAALRREVKALRERVAAIDKAEALRREAEALLEKAEDLDRTRGDKRTPQPPVDKYQDDWRDPRPAGPYPLSESLRGTGSLKPEDKSGTVTKTHWQIMKERGDTGG
jgi:polyhydroxyalkanoate synthesis regulator phasin